MKYAPKTFVSVLLVVLALGLRAAAAEHPVKLEKDADCASCHEEKTKGKAVHSAIAMGCTTCHEIKTEGETTTVNLTSPKEELCFTCHDKAKEEVKHNPYEKGQCVTCHDPHTSDYPKQLRAEGNALCMECHAMRAKMDDSVSLFGKTNFAKADFEAIPKIAPNARVLAGHPFAEHPLAGIPDPLRAGENMSCLSCHQAHAADQAKLITTPKTNNGDICEACHQAIEAANRDENEKKYGAAQQQSVKETLDKLRKTRVERPQQPGKPN